MGKIIALVNQKGGVGKTTTSINLSACLAHSGKKVLLVDSDPQANATGGLNFDKNAERSSVYDVLINEALLTFVVLKTKYKNLFLCPSHVNLAAAEIELVNKTRREFRLKEALISVKNNYDFILIDCPPSLSLLTINALSAADSVLIPVQCEYYALEGLTQLNNTIDQVKHSLNTNLQIEGILLTMQDARTNLTQQVIEQVKNFFGKQVYNTIIPRNVRLAEAPSYGEPIIAYDKHSKGAECYSQLADEVLKTNL